MNRNKRKRKTFLKSINLLLPKHKGKKIEKKHFLKLVNETISKFKGNHQKVCNTIQLGSYIKNMPNVTSSNKYYKID
jgi:hypothetical protein